MIKHDERTCENSKPCLDCENPILEHDYECQECGKVATINHQNEYHTYRINSKGDFEECDHYEGDLNEFYCEECFKNID